MPHGHLPLVVFQEQPSGRGTQGRPRTRWRDYISHLVWEFLRIPQEELESVAGHIDIWKTLLDLLPLLPDHRRQKNGQMGRVKRNVSMRQTNALLVSFVSFGLQCGRWDSGCTEKVLSLNLTGAWPFSLHVLPVLVRVSSRPLTEALLKNEHVRCHVAWLVALLQLGMSSHPRTILVQGPWALNCRWIRAISYWSVIWVIYYCCSQKKSVALPSQQTVGENVSH